MQLTKSMDLQVSGNSKQARSDLEKTIENDFKKDFLGYITGVLKSADQRNTVIHKNFKDSASTLRQLAPLGLTIILSIIGFFFIPLTFSFTRKVEIILKTIRDLDFNKNIFPVAEITGKDEFFTIAKKFNELMSRLEASKNQIEMQQRELVNASRLASLGEMSAGIAHEINNPLAIIDGSVNLLPKFINNPEKFSERIAVINRASGRVSKIINGLRKFSRSGNRTSLKEHTLSDVVKETQFLTDTKAKRHHAAVTYEYFTNAKIKCDEIEIEQVIINLVNNALDAVKNNSEKWVKVSVFEEGEEAVLQIVDSGKGIPDSIREKIFNPFFTTKDIGEGTGLGLSISKGILDEHGAKIVVKSGNPNTCFEVRFKKEILRESA